MGVIALVQGETMVRDFWPAEVAVDGKSYRLARVYVTDRRVIVVTIVNGRATKVLDSARTRAEVPHRNGVQGGRSALATEDGVVHVGVAHGCGCTSPLRALPLPQ